MGETGSTSSTWCVTSLCPFSKSEGRVAGPIPIPFTRNVAPVGGSTASDHVGRRRDRQTICKKKDRRAAHDAFSHEGLDLESPNGGDVRQSTSLAAEEAIASVFHDQTTRPRPRTFWTLGGSSERCKNTGYSPLHRTPTRNASEDRRHTIPTLVCISGHGDSFARSSRGAKNQAARGLLPQDR